MLAEFFQKPERDGGVIDELTGVGLSDDAANDQVVTREKIERIFGEDRLDLLGSAQGKYGFYGAGFFSCADQ